MKKRMLVVLAASLMTLSGAAGIVSAQPDGPGKARGAHEKQRYTVDDRLERMGKRLNLTDEQKAKIRPLLEEEADQIKAIVQTTHGKVREILTLEQQKKQDEMVNRARESRKGQRTGTPAPPTDQK